MIDDRTYHRQVKAALDELRVEAEVSNIKAPEAKPFPEPKHERRHPWLALAAVLAMMWVPVGVLLYTSEPTVKTYAPPPISRSYAPRGISATCPPCPCLENPPLPTRRPATD